MSDKVAEKGSIADTPVEVRLAAFLVASGLAFIAFTTGVGMEDGVGLTGTVVVKPGTSDEDSRHARLP